jgi:hypothetical protein
MYVAWGVNRAKLLRIAPFRGGLLRTHELGSWLEAMGTELKWAGFI